MGVPVVEASATVVCGGRRELPKVHGGVAVTGLLSLRLLLFLGEDG